ncbi:Ornithine decarboxylase [Hibiscus syriacus]|uniref:Ornithine decarboxylase n=1 Tax=Hibiscus syriacus TaxID=106335 RepID=A0A6A2ZUI4_HIBSY|nr:Ornithine decarboxylase [Hibiscus syriacus]
MVGAEPKLMENGEGKPLSVDDLIRFIRSVVISNEKQEEASPFYVLDLGAVRSLVHTWFHNLPLVQPFYAVKCNPDPVFLKEMADLGTGFDCASSAEIETVLSLGVSPDRIVFANPCKPVSHIKYAAKCALLIRVKVPETSGATFQFGSKFGALPAEIIPLLRASQEAKLQVIGVSFHIGSRAINFNAFEDAIEVAKTAFNTAAKLGLPNLRILDIGGGFTSGPQFTEAASALKLALQKHFPVGVAEGLKIMAEPGRFFSNSSFTLATSIIGKRVRDGIKEYWIDDGVSGSMNFLKYDHDEVVCTPLITGKNSRRKEMKTWNSTVFGPTCDAEDIVLKDFELPELEVDDKLVFHNMGAYTSSCGNDFNGFKTSAIPTYIANQK